MINRKWSSIDLQVQLNKAAVTCWNTHGNLLPVSVSYTWTIPWQTVKAGCSVVRQKLCTVAEMKGQAWMMLIYIWFEWEAYHVVSVCLIPVCLIPICLIPICLIPMMVQTTWMSYSLVYTCTTANLLCYTTSCMFHHRYYGFIILPDGMWHYIEGAYGPE